MFATVQEMKEQGLHGEVQYHKAFNEMKVTFDTIKELENKHSNSEPAILSEQKVNQSALNGQVAAQTGTAPKN